MGKQMLYTGPDDTPHPESYWRPVQVNLNFDGSGNVTFLGYHDIAARENKAEPIGSKIYSISDSGKFNTYFSAAVLKQNKDPVGQSYQMAMDTLDTAGQSFFKGAQDV